MSASPAAIRICCHSGLPNSSSVWNRTSIPTRSRRRPYFYKSIDSFITRGVSTQLVDQVSFILDQPVNGKGASVQGLELSYQTVFSKLPSPLDGLGTQISYTYTDSNANYVNAARTEAAHYSLQGLSKNSFTFVGFYEKGPVQARVSYTWRDHYLVAPQTQTGVPQFSDTLSTARRRSAIFNQQPYHPHGRCGQSDQFQGIHVRERHSKYGKLS